MTENTNKFTQNTEKEMSDLVRYFTFLVFPWNQILWAMDKKTFPSKKEKKMENI